VDVIPEAIAMKIDLSASVDIAKSAALRHPLWLLAWGVPLSLILSVILFDISTTNPNGSIHGVALWGRDFVNVYTSGHLAFQGKLDILYDVDAYRVFQNELFGAHKLQYHNYSYPPVTLLFTPLFALMPYYVALIVWLCGTGALFAWAARPFLRSVGVPIFLALLMPASLVNAWCGHYGFLIGALWLGAWNMMERRPVLAGAMIGAMVIKPHLAVLAPVMLAARGEWRAFFAATLTVIGLVAVSIIAFGPELWGTYLSNTAGTQAAMVDDVGTFFILMMPTIIPQLSLLGLPLFAAMLVQAVAAIATIVAIVRFRKIDVQSYALAGGLATFLILPYAFSYDMTVANLACLVGLARYCAKGGSTSQGLFLAIGFTVPVTVLTLSRLDAPVAPLFIAAALLCLFSQTRQEADVRVG
jgi:hypothetical protein